VGLGEVPSGLVDSSERPARRLLRRNKLCLLFLHFAPRLGSDWQNLGSILNFNILLGMSEDVPQLGDLMFHQILVEGVGDLQPTDKQGGSYIIIAVIHQSHLTLKIIDILLEALSRLHLDGEELVVVFSSAPVKKRTCGRRPASPPRSFGEIVLGVYRTSPRPP